MPSSARLADLVLCWQEQREQGKAITAEELCKDCPELLHEFKRRIADLGWMQDFLEFGKPVSSDSVSGLGQEGTLAQKQPPLEAGPAGAAPHLPEHLFQTGPSPQKDSNGLSADAVPRIGRYRVLRMLGQGGFGVVYLAQDEQLERPVAIKVPHGRLVSRRQDADAYLAEARTLASLDHPNIVPVHDVGSTAEFPCFIVSKFIEGCTLTDKIRDARPAAGQAAEIVAVVAEALHYAHRQGLVHRDVKPGNILLDRGGKPFVVDFGLALREDSVGQGLEYAGTPAYMSPEQARGEGHRVDGRSDIFSLGVVFYELLTGRRPFRAEGVSALLEQIATHEPKPPRQYDDTLPRELERIVLKALAKRASERYTTAKDLADDLRHLLADTSTWGRLPTLPTCPSLQPSSAEPAAPAPSSDPGPARIVPKGLRSFDAHDADFFLELLPGPRDREGLPESIRFWKSRIEEADAERTFAVGLIYGPSGCGKSSLVKAGLLPRLAKQVTAVYVEASAGETEARLLRGLRRQVTDLPGNLGLMESLAALRRGRFLESGQKVVLMLDQFEQWLHAARNEDNPELVQALRQCDGGRVQCIVMVRDDFWLGVSRFMQAVEVPLVEGENSRLVDLFDARHARKVLRAFGRALRALPERDADQVPEQDAFLDQAVAGLAQDGKIICVRLALFADMVKGKPWAPATLKEVGGTEGVGVTFLEETFTASTAPPRHRLHQKASQAVLKSLLPEAGTDIKGHMRSRQDLLGASGYGDRPNDVDELLRILDSELRLITPTEADDSRGDTQPCVSSEELTSKVACGYEKFYQLTHDYLVPSLRDWLTRKQKETRRGRAELLLADRAAVWNARPESRQLPSLLQWLQIRRLTHKRAWSAPQRKMMRRAGRYHAVRALLLAVMLALLGRGAYEGHGRLQARALRDRLLDASTTDVPTIIDDMASYRPWLEPLLREAYQEAEAYQDSRRQLHASLALLPVDETQVEYLHGRLLEAEPAQLTVIRDALHEHRQALDKRLWGVLEDRQEKAGRRFRAACALASYDHAGAAWPSAAAFVVDRLLTEVRNNPSHYAPLLELLESVRKQMLAPLSVVFRDGKRSESDRSFATSILADYAADQPQVLADLLMAADDKQFGMLFPRLKDHEQPAVALLNRELDKRTKVVDKAPAVREVLNLRGSIAKDDARVKVVLSKKTGQLRAKVFPVQLRAGKNYTMSMVSDQLDAFLVLQDSQGKQLAVDNDSGGKLNALLDYTPATDGDCKLYAAASKGSGSFTLAILETEPEDDKLASQQQEAKEALAKRQANAAVALLRMGQPQQVWPMFKHTADPRGRSYLLQRLALLGADPKDFGRRLWVEPDVSSRRALLLALGELGMEKFLASERDSLAAKVLDLYRDDPDPGLHGAAEWLLRQWKQTGQLKQIDKELASPQLKLGADPKQRRWRVNSQGQTMVLLPGPVEFWMGSPAAEADRRGGPKGKYESRHKRRIERSFAIAAKEVTVEQFLRFFPNHDYNKEYSPTSDCPVNAITWYQATEYCNRLSKEEGIAEDQWCYLPNEQVRYREKMKPASDYLKRTGYRLPTEAEWEYACRAGAVTSRFFGETEELLPRYAWYAKNSLNRSLLPAGNVPPNDLGFFDMLGNVLEWCHDPYLSYPAAIGSGAVSDLEFKEKAIIEGTSRVLRGGSFVNLSAFVRSAYRNGFQPGDRVLNVGFRAARTLTAE